jgi:hypothetical protein
MLTAKRTGDFPVAVRAEMDLRYRPTPETPKVPSQARDVEGEFAPETRSLKTHLRFERVNEVTFKVTDGERSRVPASHGQWAGFNTSRALAWVIDVGLSSTAWLARCGRQVCGPLPFNEAKAAALAMANGEVGDYETTHSIAHLNGLAARLLERAAKEAAPGDAPLRRRIIKQECEA